MDSGQRVLSYAAQNGHWRLTPRQRRRMEQKENGAWRRFSVPLFPGEPRSGKQEIPAE